MIRLQSEGDKEKQMRGQRESRKLKRYEKTKAGKKSEHKREKKIHLLKNAKTIITQLFRL